MASFTATANSDTTIGYTREDYANWQKGPTNGATQGGHVVIPGKSYVGFILFPGAGAALKDANIQDITLTITTNYSGTQDGNSTITIHKSNYQEFQTGAQPNNWGSAYVGDTLGTLTGNFYKNTTTHKLNSTTNSALFNALKTYFSQGNSAITIYNGETTTTQQGTANYITITSCTLSVNTGGVLYYYDGSKWVECFPYYYDGSKWIQCIPYYYDGSEWIQG